MNDWRTLDDDAWGTIALLIQGWWPGQFTEADELAWRMGLDGHLAGDVAQALKAEATRQAMSADSSERHWRPSLPDVLSHLVRDPNIPAGVEIVDVLWGPDGVMHVRAVGGVFIGPDGRKGADDKARLDAAVARGPLVTAFVESVGIDALKAHDPSDRMLDSEGKSWGEANRIWLGKKWDEFRERADERGVHDLLASKHLDPLAELRRRAGLAQANDRVALEESHG